MRFSVKDIGELSYFLGMKATRTEKRLHLMQEKYVRDLLKMSPKIKLNSGSLYGKPDRISNGDSNDYVSMNSSVVNLGNNPISWSSKKHSGVSRSSTEAEYKTVANTACELRWICLLLKKLGIALPTAPMIYCDKVGATYLSANPVFHSHMKHIAHLPLTSISYVVKSSLLYFE